MLWMDLWWVFLNLGRCEKIGIPLNKGSGISVHRT